MAAKGKIIKFLIVFLVFSLAIFLRLWNLNQMGRTWDEPFYVDQGYKIVDAIKKGNFDNKILYTDPDPPVFSKYLYGLAEHLNIGKAAPCGGEFCYYDFTSSRLISVLFSSLTVLLVILIGWQYVSFFVGVTAGVVFATLPISLGLSQLVTVESILAFFFTACTYSFLRLLKTFSIKNVVICGILLGLAIATKYTNIMLVPLFILIYVVWSRFNKKIKNKKTLAKKLIFIILVAFATLFFIWPFPWFHMDYVWKWEQATRFSEVASHPVPEVFFGRLMPVPIFYYFVYFLITTPFLILVLFLAGLKNISEKKKWILYVIVIWFLLPFLQSFLNMRQHGVRYVIQIYVPLSLISAIGFNFLLEKFKSLKYKYLFLIAVAIYMFIILKNITPYYLDYFNIVVGGAKGVYESRSFQMGWWGQGIREAAGYIVKNAEKGANVGIAISPSTVMPELKDYNVNKYEENKEYDYVIVNYYNIIREGFNDSKIKERYVPVYTVWADGAPLVVVYKHK